MDMVMDTDIIPTTIPIRRKRKKDLWRNFLVKLDFILDKKRRLPEPPFFSTIYLLVDEKK